jgi:hypothetical protein
VNPALAVLIGLLVVGIAALLIRQERIMSQLDDLLAAQAATVASLDQLDADVAKLSPSTPVDLTAAIANESSIKARVDAADAKVQAVVGVPPLPAAAPAPAAPAAGVPPGIDPAALADPNHPRVGG